mmetsp:Transcript_19879/g.29487  ORF Transcript_19879/g.29487 Transcript_19879/m.29487 type:complete len:413 (+) Transcript_19879:40-1278(+)
MVLRATKVREEESINNQKKLRSGFFQRREKLNPGDGDETPEGRESDNSTVVYRQFSDDPKAVMVIDEEKIPKPENGNDVVVKIQASMVSYNDCVARRGMSLSIKDPVCLPSTPGMEFVGKIVSVGREVKEWKEGDRVAALIRIGGNSRYIVVPQTSLIAVPRRLDSAEAACMVATYMTAYQSIKPCIGESRTLKGKKVLITGGIGTRGQALIQISLRAEASAIYATAPENLHRYVRSVLGAIPLPMEPRKWLPFVKGRMDVVLDGVCDDGFHSPKMALSKNGKLVCIGMASILNNESMGAFGAPLSAHWNLAKAEYFMSRTTFYDVWSSFNEDPKTFKRDLEHIFKLLAKREIKPNIAKKICLKEVSDAHIYMESGKARGAIVCLPWKRKPFISGVRNPEYTENREEEPKVQ